MFSDLNRKRIDENGLENPVLLVRIQSFPSVPTRHNTEICDRVSGISCNWRFVATVRLMNRNSGMVTAAIRSCHSRSVVQLGRTLVLGARGREFKSLHSDDQLTAEWHVADL